MTLRHHIKKRIRLKRKTTLRKKAKVVNRKKAMTVKNPRGSKSERMMRRGRL